MFEYSDETKSMYKNWYSRIFMSNNPYNTAETDGLNEVSRRKLKWFGHVTRNTCAMCDVFWQRQIERLRRHFYVQQNINVIWNAALSQSGKIDMFIKSLL